jgi:hypothetical protein
MTRRSYGSGSLFVRCDAAGQEAWYGKWYSGGRRVKRKIGPKRHACRVRCKLRRIGADGFIINYRGLGYKLWEGSEPATSVSLGSV